MTNRPWRWGRTGWRARQRGGETVEFALTLLLWFAVFLLIVNFGIAIYNKGAMSNAVRFAARQSTLYWVDPGNYDNLTPIDNTRIKQSMVDTAVAYWGSILIAPSGEAITTTFPDPTGPYGPTSWSSAGGDSGWSRMTGATVTLGLSYDHGFIGLTELLGVLGWTLGSQVSATVEPRL
jgi:hypothetical protein